MAPRVPPGSVVAAIGDLHGCSALLDAMHAALAEAFAASAAARRVVVYLGDYVSRGSDAPGTVERAMRGPGAGIESVALAGNHEELLLKFLAGDLRAGRHWLRYGGDATVAQYGAPLDDEALIDAPWTPAWHLPALEALRRRFAARLPPAHRDWLAARPRRHAEGDYLFVHAGVRPGVALSRQRERDLVWIRGAFLRSQADHGAVVVHGHCISDEPELRANRIGLDTGAYRSGVLSAVVLEGQGQRLLQVGAGRARAS